MPVYDYECRTCGVFTALRPMAEYASPMDCPECEGPARRVMVTAPMLASMDAERKSAFATNERASHEPKQLSKHGAGCSCCTQGRLKKKSKTAVAANGAKSFPTARPWMISH